jgi:hypothetical protein
MVPNKAKDAFEPRRPRHSFSTFPQPFQLFVVMWLPTPGDSNRHEMPLILGSNCKQLL